MEEVVNESVEQVQTEQTPETTETVEQPTEQPKSIDEIREQIKKVKAGEYDNDDQPQQEESESKTEEQPEEAEELTLSDDMEIQIDEDNSLTLKELKSGYLRQSDYTKKTQTLADERKQIETMQEELKPVQEFKAKMDASPYLTSQIEQLIEEYNNSGVVSVEEVLQNAQYTRYFDHILAENNKLQKEIDNLRNENQSTKLDNDMRTLESDLKTEYGELVDDDFLSTLRQQAQDEGLSIAVLKRIAKGELADKKIAKVNEENEKKQKEIEAKTIKNLQKNASTTAGALGQEDGAEQPGFAQMSKKQQREFIEKVKRGEIKQF